MTEKEAEFGTTGKDECDKNDVVMTQELFNFYYNISHSLKIVIINPYSSEVLVSDVFRAWCKRAKTFIISKKKEGNNEAVLYYKDISTGDGALLELKNKLEDEDIKVYHPASCDIIRSPNIFWDCLQDFSSLAVAPRASKCKYDWEIAKKIIIVENIAESCTEEELIKQFSEASNVICFPHGEAKFGFAALEFETDSVALSFLRKHKKMEKEKEDQTITVNSLSDKLMQWKKNSEKQQKKEEIKNCKLSDEERLAKCQQVKELEEEQKNTVNSEDCYGDEKIIEHLKKQEKAKPLISELTADAKRRRDNKLPFPEGEEIKPVSRPKNEQRKEMKRSFDLDNEGPPSKKSTNDVNTRRKYEISSSLNLDIDDNMSPSAARMKIQSILNERIESRLQGKSMKDNPQSNPPYARGKQMSNMGMGEGFVGRNERFMGMNEPAMGMGGFPGMEGGKGGGMMGMGMNEGYSGMQAGFMGMNEGFGGMNEYNMGMNDNIGMNEGFGGMDECNMGMNEGFGGMDECNMGMNERFGGMDECNIGMNEGLGGMDECIMGMNEETVGMKKGTGEMNKFMGMLENFIDMGVLSVNKGMMNKISKEGGMGANMEPDNMDSVSTDNEKLRQSIQKTMNARLAARTMGMNEPAMPMGNMGRFGIISKEGGLGGNMELENMGSVSTDNEKLRQSIQKTMNARLEARNMGPNMPMGNVGRFDNMGNIGIASNMGNMATGGNTGNMGRGSNMGNMAQFRNNEGVDNYMESAITGNNMDFMGNEGNIGNMRGRGNITNMGNRGNMHNMGSTREMGNMKSEGYNMGNTSNMRNMGNMRSGDNMDFMGRGSNDMGNTSNMRNMGNMRSGDNMGNMGRGGNMTNLQGGVNIGYMGRGGSMGNMGYMGRGGNGMGNMGGGSNMTNLRGGSMGNMGREGSSMGNMGRGGYTGNMGNMGRGGIQGGTSGKNQHEFQQFMTNLKDKLKDGIDVLDKRQKRSGTRWQ